MRFYVVNYVQNQNGERGESGKNREKCSKIDIQNIQKPYDEGFLHKDRGSDSGKIRYH